uniref:Uncharacterized protein n=2 Tax=Cacopsylla melanoneura TaxID=428564 RepID=A0A8D9ELC3_9HEMI
MPWPRQRMLPTSLRPRLPAPRLSRTWPSLTSPFRCIVWTVLVLLVGSPRQNKRWRCSWNSCPESSGGPSPFSRRKYRRPASAIRKQRSLRPKPNSRPSSGTGSWIGWRPHGETKRDASRRDWRIGRSC